MMGLAVPNLGFRTDIQALRGIAILFVLLFHAQLNFDGGYLGVDVFFVISGFLITSFISKELSAGKFSLTQFYARRAKRLLPAAYVVLLVCTLLAPRLLADQEYYDFVKQVVGAITFTANIVLWRQSGYFDGAAELKPLLHTWSLSIEEQYYLLVPALLLLVRYGYWRQAIALITISSLALYAWLSETKPTDAFYLFPTRAWELGIGSMAALFDRRSASRQGSIIGALFWPSLLSIVLLAWKPDLLGRQSLANIAVCVATFVIIKCEHNIFEKERVWKPLTALGTISYSVYLVHWPLLAFLNNAWIGNLPPAVGISGVVLSILLAIALYRFVEHPIHQMPHIPLRRIAAWGLSSSAALVAISLILASSAPPTGVLRQPAGNWKLGCDFTQDFRTLGRCFGRAPDVLVWGDSFAEHLLPGIADTGKELIVVGAIKHLCGPLLEMAPLSPSTSRSWARDCAEHNRAVLSYLANQPSIDIVVLSSPFRQYVGLDGFSILDFGATAPVTRRGSVNAAFEGLQRTVSAIHALGRRVVIIGPPPAANFDVGLCLRREAEGKWLAHQYRDCQIPLRIHLERQALALSVLDRATAKGIAVLRLDEAMCSGEVCRTFQEGVALYKDNAHLSSAGSIVVARQLRLIDLARDRAQ